ncbi:homoserine O-acetyltransferase MetX [Rothia nasimurium]|uniref:homoserine O-acetyltransferase MetX n=1 Tax=Rothia nasimurium TaxID=85336 RepID=UPI001F00CA27|nr:homoserine O-acetyltransferase [Rothia nasimurium]
MTTARPADSAPHRTDGVLTYASIGDLTLESGAVLPDITIGYETWGTLNEAGDNAVLILHALTGDTHVSAGRVGADASEQDREAAEAAGWWPTAVGPGRVIDTDKYFVISPNMLGGCYGTTGPASPAPASIDPEQKPWGSRFPLVTIRDGVHAEKRLLDQLGVTSLHHVIGGSLGGARAAEWAVTYPELVRSCAVIASGPAATAEQIAWGHMQNLAIRQDPAFAGGDYYPGPGPVTGLALARRIAHTTYRSAAELHFRFGRDAQDGHNVLHPVSAERGRYQVENYLDHHGTKLTNRFDAGSYLAINEALLSHDLGRDRGGLEKALARTVCNWTIAYVDSDRLFFPSDSHILAASLPNPVEPAVIHSPCGHDGFLIEHEQLERILATSIETQDAADEAKLRGRKHLWAVA